MTNTRSSCTPRRSAARTMTIWHPMLKGAKKNMQAIGKQPELLPGQTVHRGQQLLLPCQSGALPDGTIGCLYPGYPVSQARSTLPRAAAIQEWHSSPNTIRTTETKFTDADFVFDDSKQVYVCPQGKVLKRGARSQRNRYRVYDIYRARQQDCAACPVRSKCLSKPTTSRRFLSIEVDSPYPNLIEQMKARIDTPARQADLCQASGDRRAGLCQSSRPKAFGSLHRPLESQSGCAVEVVRSRPQHW